jgi:hypothetical protein
MRNKTELRPKKSPPTPSPSQPSGLIAKKPWRSAGPTPALDDHSHRTTLEFCCLPHYAVADPADRTGPHCARRAPCDGQQQFLVRRRSVYYNA